MRKASIKIDEAEESVIETERCISKFWGEVDRLSMARSKLKGRMAELTEEAKVTFEKAIADNKASEAFMDKVNESSLDMFLRGFDECQKKLWLLYLDLDLSKLEGCFQTRTDSAFCFVSLIAFSFFYILWAFPSPLCNFNSQSNEVILFHTFCYLFGFHRSFFFCSFE